MSRARNHRFLIVLTMTLMLGLAATGTAVAARGGGHHQKSTSNATLSGPAQVHVGESYTITGSGFQPGTGVSLTVGEADGCCYALMIVTESDGTFSYSGSVWGAGAYKFWASVPTNRGYELAATFSFQAS